MLHDNNRRHLTTTMCVSSNAKTEQSPSDSLGIKDKMGKIRISDQGWNLTYSYPLCKNVFYQLPF